VRLELFFVLPGKIWETTFVPSLENSIKKRQIDAKSVNFCPKNIENAAIL
jgi:hypothetical protein